MAIPSTLYPLLLRAFLAMGKARVSPKIPSRQLTAALEAIELSNSAGVLHIPHYWAAYVHDGRPPVTPQTATFLVWFRNPHNDPRYKGGKYPVYKSDIRRLTEAEFKKWVLVNRGIIQRYKKATGKKHLTSDDYRDMDLPMIVCKRSPRIDTMAKQPESNFFYAEGVPFFSNAPGGGMHGFQNEVNAEGRRIVNAYVKERLTREGILNKKITQTIQI